MTHWYREPKRVRLIEYLDHANLAFVLNAEQFSENDLARLRSIPPALLLIEKFSRGTVTEADARNVFIIAPVKRPNSVWLENPVPWAGVIILPPRRPFREHALRSIFTLDRTVDNGSRGTRAIRKGILHRFVLDLSTGPASFYGVKEP
jgi:hypothetical protein